MLTALSDLLACAADFNFEILQLFVECHDSRDRLFNNGYETGLGGAELGRDEGSIPQYGISVSYRVCVVL